MQAPVDYLLHLADSALILGQRNSEWCGHGPILEEDLALANNSLDLIGQARLLYQLAAQRINANPELAARFAHLQGARVAGELSEDSLAYFRAEHEFCNHTLLELPHSGPLAGTAAGDRDYAVTIARNFLYSAYMALVWEGLTRSSDADLASIAAKSLKEVRYHVEHASDWLERFGDGTDLSQAKAQAALNHLMPYTQGFWQHTPAVADAIANGSGVDPKGLREAWSQWVDEVLQAAQLQCPSEQGHVPQGQVGVHSEHMGFVLATLQSLARAHPQATW